MQTAGAVLLYNFSGPRREEIQALCEACGLTPVPVAPACYGEKIGALLELDGYARTDTPFSGEVFTDEMMVICTGSQTLRSLLEEFQNRRVRRVDLKAMLTQTNAGWDSAALHGHLLAEHRMMQEKAEQARQKGEDKR